MADRNIIQTNSQTGKWSFKLENGTCADVDLTNTQTEMWSNKLENGKCSHVDHINSQTGKCLKTNLTNKLTDKKNNYRLITETRKQESGSTVWFNSETAMRSQNVVQRISEKRKCLHTDPSNSQTRKVSKHSSHKFADRKISTDGSYK